MLENMINEEERLC